MKKIFLSLLLLVTTSASADWHGRCCYRSGWVAPLIVGGIIGYELSRPRYETYYNVPPAVMYTPPPVYVQPSVSLMPQQPLARYHWQEIIDPVTGTPKMALVPN